MSRTILDYVGNTPLLQMEGIHVKCEQLNPSGSIKDRIAKYFIEHAEKEGLLKKGDTIVEASTGNTGIALSMVGSMKGYKVIIFIAEGLSRERYQIMKSFGADIRRVPKDRMDQAVQKAMKLGKKKGYFHIDQFSTRWNIEDHQRYMGQEILRQLKWKKIDAVVAGIGTGGSIIGLAKAFKQYNPNVKIYGVEPTECALVHGFIHKLPEKCKTHKIEGIADGFVPNIIRGNHQLIDDIIVIKSKNAIKEAKRIARHHGCFVGVCSGANLLAAKQVQAENPKFKTIVTLFTDRGERYLSEDWFCD